MNNTQELQEKIQVVFTPYDMADSYNRHVGAAITSLLINCSMPVIIHILYDEKLNCDTIEYNENKIKYKSFEDKYNVEIIFHNVNIPDWYHSLRGSKILSVGTYYRLFIPDVLKDIHRVIYLDGDVIVTLDLKELWDIDIKDNAIAARIDPIFQDEMNRNPKNFIPVYQKLNFNRNDLLKYFNAGILYMNLDFIRNSLSLSDSGGKYLKDYPKTPRADQDALNYLFINSIYYLPDKYNFFAYEAGDTIPKACIHYVTIKPWKSHNKVVDNEYWKYLSISPWCPNRDTFIEYISAVGNSSVEALNLTMSQIPLVQLTKIIIIHYKYRIKRYLFATGKIK